MGGGGLGGGGAGGGGEGGGVGAWGMTLTDERGGEVQSGGF